MDDGKNDHATRDTRKIFGIEERQNAPGERTLCKCLYVLSIHGGACHPDPVASVPATRSRKLSVDLLVENVWNSRAPARLANESSVLKANETDRKQIVAVNGYHIVHKHKYILSAAASSFVSKMIHFNGVCGGGRQISTFSLSVKKNVEYKIAQQKDERGVIRRYRLVRLSTNLRIFCCAYTASTGHGERERGGLNAAQTLDRLSMLTNTGWHKRLDVCTRRLASSTGKRARKRRNGKRGSEATRRYKANDTKGT